MTTSSLATSSANKASRLKSSRLDRFSSSSSSFSRSSKLFRFHRIDHPTCNSNPKLVMATEDRKLPLRVAMKFCQSAFLLSSGLEILGRMFSIEAAMTVKASELFCKNNPNPPISTSMFEMLPLELLLEFFIFTFSVWIHLLNRI